jgi:hypothetical protein
MSGEVLQVDALSVPCEFPDGAKLRVENTQNVIDIAFQRLAKQLPYFLLAVDGFMSERLVPNRRSWLVCVCSSSARSRCSKIWNRDFPLSSMIARHRYYLQPFPSFHQRRRSGKSGFSNGSQDVFRDGPSQS